MMNTYYFISETKYSFLNLGKDFGIHGLAESIFKYPNCFSFKLQFNIQVRTLILTKEGQMRAYPFNFFP